VTIHVASHRGLVLAALILIAIIAALIYTTTGAGDPMAMPIACPPSC
jgi:hypothetical protein